MPGPEQERKRLQLKEREQRLDFMVTRALDVSLLTGELIICKHQDELGDPGLRRLEQRLVRAEPSPAYRQNSTLTCTARACRAADSQPASAPVQSKAKAVASSLPAVLKTGPTSNKRTLSAP